MTAKLNMKNKIVRPFCEGCVEEAWTHDLTLCKFMTTARFGVYGKKNYFSQNWAFLFSGVHCDWLHYDMSLKPEETAPLLNLRGEYFTFTISFYYSQSRSFIVLVSIFLIFCFPAAVE